MPHACSDRDLLLAELTACAAHPAVAAGRRGIEVYAGLLADRHAFLAEATGHDPEHARLTRAHRPDEDGDCLGCISACRSLSLRVSDDALRWPCGAIAALADAEGVDLVRKRSRPRLTLVRTEGQHETQA